MNHPMTTYPNRTGGTGPHQAPRILQALSVLPEVGTTTPTLRAELDNEVVRSEVPPATHLEVVVSGPTFGRVEVTTQGYPFGTSELS